MAPGTHAVISWWTANVLPLARRDRLLVLLAGVLPDLDGLGLLYDLDAYLSYHHVLLHNLFAGLICSALVGLLAIAHVPCLTLALLNWHLHLACDYFGSRGPWDSPPWVLPYLYPLVGGWQGQQFTGPSWYWNPFQWPLNGWPNLVVTLCGLAGLVFIAIRLDRTWFEFLSLRFDKEVCRFLRKRLGGQATEAWSNGEARLIRASFLLVATTALLACVVAAARA